MQDSTVGFRREREINNCQADEDYSPEWLHGRRIGPLSIDDIQELDRLCKGFDWGDAAVWDTT
jgi:hypothetical protein